MAQRATERRMLRVTRNEEIRKRTQVKDVIQKAFSLKWSWAGHLRRRTDNRWTRKVTEWQPRTGGGNRTAEETVEGRVAGWMADDSSGS